MNVNDFGKKYRLYASIAKGHKQDNKNQDIESEQQK